MGRMLRHEVNAKKWRIHGVYEQASEYSVMRAAVTRGKPTCRVTYRRAGVLRTGSTVARVVRRAAVAVTLNPKQSHAIGHAALNLDVFSAVFSSQTVPSVLG